MYPDIFVVFQPQHKGRRRKGSGIVYKVVVRTDERKSAGTDPHVSNLSIDKSLKVTHCIWSLV